LFKLNIMNKIVLPTNYNLYDFTYSNDLPYEQIYISTYGVIPSKYVDGNKYDENITAYFISKGYNIVSEFVFAPKKYETRNVGRIKLLFNEQKAIFIKISNDFNNDDCFSIQYLYSIRNGHIKEQIKFDEVSKYLKVKKKKASINLVKTTLGNLDCEAFDVVVPDIDIELNYGKSFTRVHDVILKSLKKEKSKGIVLLHGEPGTGKTSYIKYLTSLIIDKEILIIPPSMAESLSDPLIIPFLMEHKNSILIIEDAEKVISDRTNGGIGTSVSNILNLTDGILGDCLSIQIVATFNMSREKIDNALLRKGRLIAEHKFQKLDVDETNKLLKYLNKDYVATESMALSDIYNIDVELIKSENKQNQIGFYANSR